MTLQDLGALEELVGAVAVVLTLLYVAAQIRQNTRGLRSATAFAVNQALAEINGRWVSSADGFTELWLRGCADPDDLPPGADPDDSEAAPDPESPIARTTRSP